MTRPNVTKQPWRRDSSSNSSAIAKGNLSRYFKARKVQKKKTNPGKVREFPEFVIYSFERAELNSGRPWNHDILP